MSSGYSAHDGDSMATDSQAPSAFENEPYYYDDDSVMTESLHTNMLGTDSYHIMGKDSGHIMGNNRTDRSTRSIDSESAVFDNNSSMQRLVDGIEDVDKQFGSLLNSQANSRRESSFSQGSVQTTDVSGLQAELDSARLNSPLPADIQNLQQEFNGAQMSSPSNNNGIVVETVDEESCHETGLTNASMRKLPSGGPSILGNIQEEEEHTEHEEPKTVRQRQRPPKDSSQRSEVNSSQRSEVTVETVDEESCHESGIFSSERNRSVSSNLTGISEEQVQHQEEFDPSVYKKREQPAAEPSPQQYDSTSSSRFSGFNNPQGMGAAPSTAPDQVRNASDYNPNPSRFSGFNNPQGTGAAPSTAPEWDNLQSTLDQETDQVRNAPYYNTPPDGERPTSPTGNYEHQPDTDGLRKELDDAALQPPNTGNSHDVEAQQPTSNNSGGYWQGDKGYDERYDDEILDDSQKGGGAAGAGAGAPVQARWVNNGGDNGPGKTTESAGDRFKRQLTHVVGNDSNYQILVKALGGCIGCMALWTLIMIIVLLAK